MLTSYHVHSFFSDGKCAISDHIERAIALGINELGISDHYVLLPGNAHHGMGTLAENLTAYINALRAATEQAGDKLIVRYGVEVDYDPEMIDQVMGILSPLPLDYVLGSVHIIDGFPIDRSKEDWDALTQPERNDMIREYWVRIAQMARTGFFNIAAHLDLYKKFGHGPTIDVSAEISTALDAIAEAGMAVELNTAGWHIASEQYPSLSILRECRLRNIPTLITADAHVPENLTRSFDRGKQMLIELGYAEQAVFAGKKMTLAPLY